MDHNIKKNDGKRKGRRRTHEDFVSLVKDLHGDDYAVLNKYTTKRNKVKVLHNTCGKEHETAAGNLIREGRGKCPHCKTAWNRRSHEDYVNEFYEVANINYSLLSEYTTALETVEVKHNDCGHVWHVRAQHFLDGIGCPKCGHKQAMEVQSLKPDVFAGRVKELYGEEYTLLSQYERMSKPIQLMHNVCGHIFNKAASDVLAGCLCPGCKETARMTSSKFKAAVNELTDAEYTCLGSYVNSKAKISMKHNQCSHVWDVMPSMFMSGTRCPRCRGSKGEAVVEHYLMGAGIEYEPQYRFDDCRNINPLPFDFALFESGELLCLVEYHGEQHYRSVEFFGGIEEYQKRLSRDAIKEEYCKRNNIPLIIIPHYEVGTESYLENKLDELKTLV